jgi:hypothetical protein
MKMEHFMKSKLLKHLLVLLTITVCALTTLHATNLIGHDDKLDRDSIDGGTEYGSSIDMDGDWLIVGGPLNGATGTSFENRGRAWFYERQSDGTWYTIPLTGNVSGGTSVAGDEFGTSVSISGDYAVVGAPKAEADPSVQVSEGEAFIFYNHPTNGWELLRIVVEINGVDTEIIAPPLTATSPGANDLFGHSVSISGTRLIVGAPGRDEAMIYEQNGTSGDFELIQTLTPPMGANEQEYGYQVAIDGDRVAVSAVDTGDDSTAGAVFVYDFNSTSGLYELASRLEPSQDLSLGSGLGKRISLDGDTVIASIENSSSVGRVYVYTLQKDGSTWLNEGYLNANNAEANDAFGRTGIDINDGLIAVGAFNWRGSHCCPLGKTYIFARAASGIWEQLYETEENLANSEDFGSAVVISESDLFVGARGNNTGGNRTGLVYHYLLPDNSYASLGTGSGSGTGGWVETANAVHTSKDVGIDTSIPSAKLHIYSNDDATDLASLTIENEDANTIVNDRELILLKNFGGSRINMENTNLNRTWRISTPNNYDHMNFTVVGSGVNEMYLDIDGNLVVHNDATVGGTYYGAGLSLGTSTPEERMHVYSTNNDSDILLENDSTTLSDANMLTLKNYGGARIDFVNTAQSNETWRITNPNNQSTLNFTVVGSGSNEMTLSESGDLTVLGDIDAGGTITWPSDRNIKENFKPVDHHAVLEKVVALEVTEWNYIHNADNIRHIGPMAQDWYAAFRVGANEKTISSSDMNGVALASFKALNEQLEERKDEITDLKTQIARIEALLEKVAAQ